MRIKSLQLREGISTGFFEFKDTTVVISRHNKAGKTTLLRCLLYALGYPIPSMRGFDFETVEFNVVVQTSAGTEVRLKRFGSTIELSRPGSEDITTFSLPADRNGLHKILFGIEDETVLDNLLGAFYFDQEKGWTLLNRGKVIGSIHFSIEDFLRGLLGNPCKKERADLATIEEEIRKYQYMLNVSQYQAAFTESGDTMPFETPAEEVAKEIFRLRNKRKPLENEVRRLRSAIKGNDEFRRYIDSLQLRIRVPNGDLIPITANNLDGFSDTSEYLRAKLANVQEQIAVIDNQIAALEGRQSQTETLFDVQTLIQRFAEGLSHIDIDTTAVEGALKKLKERKVQLAELIRGILITERMAVESLTRSVISYLREFGIDEQYGKNIFTSDLKSFSGTIFHLQVFAFKISYAKLVRERTGCVLPLIIDSPNGREVEKDIVKKMMEILLRDFSDHQVVIATIYNPQLPNQATIELNNGVMHFNEG